MIANQPMPQVLFIDNKISLQYIRKVTIFLARSSGKSLILEYICLNL